MKEQKSKYDKKPENPPLLTGGLKPENNDNMKVGNLINVNFDWLTVTVGTQGRKRLLEYSEYCEIGNPIKGFGKSESRYCLGGFCWRKMHPLCNEVRLGLGKNYESWEFTGNTASIIIPKLTDIECKPTRIDIAFDFQVAPDYLADDWLND